MWPRNKQRQEEISFLERCGKKKEEKKSDYRFVSRTLHKRKDHIVQSVRQTSHKVSQSWVTTHVVKHKLISSHGN